MVRNFLEFFLVKGVKPILFETTPKILNKNFDQYVKKPIEIDLRKEISIIFDNGNYAEFIKLLNDIKDKKFDKLKISDFIKNKCKFIFYES